MSAARVVFVTVAVAFECGCSTKLFAFQSLASDGGGGGNSSVSGGGPNVGGGAGRSENPDAGSGGRAGGPTAGSGGGGTSAPNGTITRVTVASDGTEANAGTLGAALSGDGRFVAFSTGATNLIPGDTNEEPDVFVRDLASGELFCASRLPDGGSANGASLYPSLSHDGRDLAFGSFATDFGASGGRDDTVLLHRALEAPDLEAVSSSLNYSGGAAIVNGGREFVFATITALLPEDSNQVSDVYLRASDGTLELVSRNGTGAAANGSSVAPVVSADGNVIVFESDASDLVPGDMNGQGDIFAYDRARGEFERVSIASDGSEADGYSTAASISADGLHVAFTSLATNLVPNDTNGVFDVFVHDRVTHETVRASVGNGGTETDRDSQGPSLDGTGRVVVFSSFALNLDPACSQPVGVFLRDLSTSRTFCLTPIGTPSLSDESDYAVVSDDARTVAYSSYAPTLVDDDTNLVPDVFVVRYTTAPWL